MYFVWYKSRNIGLPGDTAHHIALFSDPLCFFGNIDALAGGGGYVLVGDAEYEETDRLVVGI